MRSTQRKILYRLLLAGTFAWWFALFLMILNELMGDQGLRHLDLVVIYGAIGVPPLALGLYLRAGRPRRH